MISNIYLTDLDKNKAYMRESLYLPKKDINISPITAALTFYHQSGVSIKQYFELDNHIIVPRYFLSIPAIAKKVEVIDIRPKRFKKIEETSNITFRNDLQKESAFAIRNNEGILVLPCGTGKTVIAINEIIERQVPTLVVVNNEQIFDQWRKGITGFTSVQELGKIQGSVFDWEKPIVIGMLQTLAKRRNTIPEKVRKYFGLIIWDEVDEISTPVYSSTADIFYGKRMGLTATDIRKDGAEKIFQYHIGPHLFTNKEFKQKPRVYFVTSTIFLNMQDYTFRWSPDKINFGKLYTDLSTNTLRNNQIKDLITKKLAQGRKILVLGERVEQLKELYDSFPGSGICIGSVEVDERTEMLDRCKVIFATRKLSKRGLDQPDLDTLLCLYPMSDSAGLQQACGRIIREYDNKKSPEVLIIEDVNIMPLKAICYKMRKIFKEWEFETSNMTSKE